MQAAGMYHVTTHAVANSWLFLEDTDYQARLAMLADAVQRGLMRWHAFCLMGNHEHLLITVDDGCIARLMQRVNRAYAGLFNQFHGRRGRLYREPYGSVPVVTDRHLVELIRYLALNPEVVGFGKAESYRWSSYPALIGVVRQPSYIDPAPLLDAIGGGESARRRIADFVQDGRLRRRGGQGRIV
jgi:REP element-mobilizing transposase RayT